MTTTDAPAALAPAPQHGLKVAYKPVHLVVTVVAGFIASRLMQRVWSAKRDEPHPPKATDASTTLPRVAAGAALQAAVVAGAKAGADRLAARRFAKNAGAWPR